MRNWKAVWIGLAAILALGPFVGGEEVPEVPRSAPKVVQSLQAPGLDVRYVDFKWDAEAFASNEKGGGHPAARRSWVLARLLATTNPFRCAGKIIPVGPSLLILNPGKKGAPPTLELRAVDMREIFVDMNVIAEPPPGDTYYQGPARFRKVGSTAERLLLRLADDESAVDVFIHYGDFEAKITLTRS
jgi:hypothetical protein